MQNSRRAVKIFIARMARQGIKPGSGDYQRNWKFPDTAGSEINFYSESAAAPNSNVRLFVVDAGLPDINPFTPKFKKYILLIVQWRMYKRGSEN